MYSVGHHSKLRWKAQEEPLVDEVGLEKVALVPQGGAGTRLKSNRSRATHFETETSGFESVRVGSSLKTSQIDHARKSDWNLNAEINWGS